MIEALTPFFNWIKWLHIAAVMSWMAGLFYLPRLFVYHAERGKAGSELSETLKIMEFKLLNLIMKPAMYVTWATGLSLAVSPQIGGFSGNGWLHAKLGFVVAMTVFHVFCARWRQDFATESNTRSGRFYRISNEAPTVLMLLIVAMVVFKPF